MESCTAPTRKGGRRSQHNKPLKPSGHTEEQDRILAVLAEDRGVPKAHVERAALYEYLLQFGYDKEQQGLTYEPI